MKNFTLVFVQGNSYVGLSLCDGYVEANPLKRVRTSGTYTLKWKDCCITPLPIYLVDIKGERVADPILNVNQYFAAQITRYNKKMQAVLQYVNGGFRLGTNLPDEDTVYINVQYNKNMYFNDTRTQASLKVGQDLVMASEAMETIDSVFLCPFSPGSNGTLNMSNTDVIIGPKCRTVCAGKKCTDGDGCGGICRCPYGLTCNKTTGKCQSSKETCTGNVPCGGLCSGPCPSGNECLRDMNGVYECRPKTANNFLVAALAFFLVLSILLYAFSVTRQN